MRRLRRPPPRPPGQVRRHETAAGSLHTASRCPMGVLSREPLRKKIEQSVRMPSTRATMSGELGRQRDVGELTQRAEQPDAHQVGQERGPDGEQRRDQGAKSEADDKDDERQRRDLDQDEIVPQQAGLLYARGNRAGDEDLPAQVGSEVLGTRRSRWPVRSRVRPPLPRRGRLPAHRHKSCSHRPACGRSATYRRCTRDVQDIGRAAGALRRCCTGLDRAAAAGRADPVGHRDPGLPRSGRRPAVRRHRWRGRCYGALCRSSYRLSMGLAGLTTSTDGARNTPIAGR